MKRAFAVWCSLMLACGEPGQQELKGKTQVQALEGARNDAFRAAASKHGLPLELLMSVAHHQGHFELPPDANEQAEAPAADPAVQGDVTPPSTEVESAPEMEAADPEAPAQPEAVMELAPDETDLGLQTELTADALADDAETGLDPMGDKEAMQEGDAHSGLQVFGLMYLTPEQVTRAAELTGSSEEAIRTDLAANIDGAAAVLADLAKAAGIDAMTADLDAWAPAIAKFVGADGDAEVTRLAVSAVKDLYVDGFDVMTSDGEHLQMIGIGRETASVAQELTPGKYPPIQFIAAASSNYSSRSGGKVRFVVIHDIEGTMPGAIAVFRNPSRGASAHYIIRSSDGHIVQMVSEAKKAWHAGHGWFNANSIGIEHEGFANKPRGGGFYNTKLYTASSNLVCAIAKKYSIPVDRKHIFGHGNVPSSLSSTTICSDARANAGACGGVSHHHDPGKFWDWTTYMRLVARCVSNKPAPTPTPTPQPPPTSSGTTVKGLIYKGTNTAAQIAGATVRLGTLTTKSDANGYYEFTKIPAGTKTITVSASGYITQSITRAVSGKETWGSVGLKANPPSGTAKLIGVVTRGTSTRVAGATVKLSNGRSTTTNASGVYTLTGLAPGTYTITATKSGVGTGNTSRTVTNGTETWGSVKL
ncbi:MAG: N-acetylmuramoyl-L-alanine amidase [Archangiaceae bacterium]|nr:N-acetylmuramoyl-L-alanine amidase [Archangiaceae bacterium]